MVLIRGRVDVQTGPGFLRHTSVLVNMFTDDWEEDLANMFSMHGILWSGLTYC